MPTPSPTTLVVGAGGLLGRNVLTAGGVAPSRAIRWSEPEAALEDLAAVAADLSGPVRIAWCAGAGIVGSGTESMEAEARNLAGFLDHLDHSRVEVRALFLASSAGAVYAGTHLPLLSETSPTVATSAYGEGKLHQERLVAEWGTARGVPTVIGRISNLYGPGQNLDKPQGLLSWAVRASLLRQPLTIYVDLDTRRDYLYAPDAGKLVLHALDEAEQGGSQIRILASGRSVTVGELIQELGRLRRRRVPAVFARNDRTDLQPRSLVYDSVHPDPVHRTPLTVGLAAVLAEQLGTLQAGALS